MPAAVAQSAGGGPPARRPLPRVYTHTSPRQTLLPHLLPLLPATLPLVRRIQFHLQTPFAVALATISPEARPASAPASGSSEEVVDFAAAYVDRSRAPETECWAFSTAQLRRPASGEEGSFDQQQGHQAHLLSLFSAIAQLPVPPAPDYPHSTSDPSLMLTGALHATALLLLKSTGKARTTADDEGASSAPIGSQSNGTTREAPKGMYGPSADTAGVVRGHTVPYMKFIFAPPAMTPESGHQSKQQQEGTTPSSAASTHSFALPLDLKWSTLRSRADFEKVISRTDIPRKVRTLENLPNVAIRLKQAQNTTQGVSMEMGSRLGMQTAGGASEKHGELDTSAPRKKSDAAVEEDGAEGEAIGWAFLGPDASLTSLHVEPAYRGRGLAKALTHRAFNLLTSPSPSTHAGIHNGKVAEPVKEFVGVQPELAYSHSDVARENLASIGVAKALGGMWGDEGEGWIDYWVVIDLESVRRAVK